MAGVLKALTQYGVKIYRPISTVDEIDGEEEAIPTPRLDYRPFESPRPRTSVIEVQDKLPSSSPLFHYFLDGSMRTINAGYLRDPRERFLPIFVAQIGVAATKLDGSHIRVERYDNKNILFVPDSFRDRDIRKMGQLVREAARSSSRPIKLELECYAVDDTTEPVDSARARILAAMHSMETGFIRRFAATRKVTRDRLLMIDGSLQFYENLEQNKEAFRNVVGVSKSFKLNDRIGTGSRAKQVGTLVAHLKPGRRTPARKISHKNLAIGAWYLRLRTPTRNKNAFTTEGVVKLEVFPDHATGPQPVLDTDRCNLISSNVLALRHPATPWTDARWASHLYPIYLTEQYVKSRFHRQMTMRAFL